MSAPPATIDVSDLVAGTGQPRARRIPWVAGGVDPATGLCCAGLAWLVQRRCGHDVPDHALVQVRDGARADAALAAFLATGDDCWALLGATPAAATNAGDIIVSRGRTGPHLSTLINPRTRKAVTTSRGTGVQLITADRIPNVTAVYRWRGLVA